MRDINKIIMDQGAYEADPEGNLVELEPWSQAIANSIAQQEGLSLTQEHWSALAFMREHYRRHGPVGNAREMTRLLAQAFAKQGGKRYLYQLFPKGPVSQGSRIAGLPVPPHSRQLSFGSVE